jgi:sugar phosphate isomerase/epimerase
MPPPMAPPQEPRKRGHVLAITVLAGVIVVALVIGVLGVVGVIGVNRGRSTSASSDRQPTDENPTTFCSLMDTSGEGLRNMSFNNPQDSPEATEEARWALATLRHLKDLAAEDVRGQFDLAIEFVESWQEYIETGEQPVDFSDRQTAFDLAWTAIDEKKAMVCP